MIELTEVGLASTITGPLAGGFGLKTGATFMVKRAEVGPWLLS